MLFHFLVLSVFACVLPSAAQSHLIRRRKLEGCLTQVGYTLAGPQSNDLFGRRVSINANGSVVAIGANSYDAMERWSSGLVRVFEFASNRWKQRGRNIEGETNNDQLFTNALSDDGNVVAVGAPHADDEFISSGYVRVYDYINDNWEQRGNTIVGLGASLYFGWSVELSGDGNVLAVEAGYFGNAKDWFVEAFQWNGTEWSARGDRIQQTGERSLGFSLSRDGSVLAVAPRPFYPPVSWRVQIFEFFKNNWVQLGQNLNGYHPLSLSADGQTLVCQREDGQVQLYHFNGSVWVQLGKTSISSPSALSLSGDGSILAVGQVDATNYTGMLQVFQLEGTSWQQIGNDIRGDLERDSLGTDVAISRDGTTVVAGGDSSSGRWTGRPGFAVVYNVNITCESGVSLTNDTELPTPISIPTLVPTTMSDPSSMPTPTIPNQNGNSGSHVSVGALVGIILGAFAAGAAAILVAVLVRTGYRKRRHPQEGNNHQHLPPPHHAEDPPQGEPGTVAAALVNIESGVNLEEMQSNILLVDVPAPHATLASAPGGLVEDPGVPEANVRDESSGTRQGPRFKDQSRNATPPKARQVPPEALLQGQQQHASARHGR